MEIKKAKFHNFSGTLAVLLAVKTVTVHAKDWEALTWFDFEESTFASMFLVLIQKRKIAKDIYLSLGMNPF